jgi:hypothetical protein
MKRPSKSPRPPRNPPTPNGSRPHPPDLSVSGKRLPADGRLRRGRKAINGIEPPPPPGDFQEEGAGGCLRIPIYRERLDRPRLGQLRDEPPTGLKPASTLVQTQPRKAAIPFPPPLCTHCAPSTAHYPPGIAKYTEVQRSPLKLMKSLKLLKFTEVSLAPGNPIRIQSCCSNVGSIARS